MNDTIPQTNESTEDEARRLRNLTRLNILIVAGAGVSLPFYIYQSLTGEFPQLLSLTVAVLIVLAGNILSLVMSRRDRLVQAAWLTLLSSFVTGSIAPLIVADSGALIGIVIGAIGVLGAWQTLPSHQVSRGILVSIGAAIFIVLLDLFGPSDRIVIPVVNLLVFVIGGPVILVLGYFVVQQFPDFTMRVKLIVATAVVAVTAVLAVAFLASQTTRAALTEEIGGNLQDLAESQALSIGELLFRQVSVLETLAVNEFLQKGATAQNNTYVGDLEAIQASLAELNGQWTTVGNDDPLVTNILENDISFEFDKFRKLFPNYLEMILTDQYGALVAASSPPEFYYFGDEEWWASSFSNGVGAVYIGEPRVDENLGSVVLDIAIPVYNAEQIGSVAINQEVAGVVRSTLNLLPLRDIISAARFGQTGFIEIILPNNQELKLADNSTRDILELKTANAEVIESLNEVRFSTDPFLVASHDEESSLISQAVVNTLNHEPRVDRLGWTVVAIQSESEALIPVRAQQRTNWLLGIVVVIGVSAAAAALSQVLTRPITELTEVALKVSEGDLTAHAAIQSKDEMGILGHTFNHMTEQLRASIIELEERVAERTRALETSIDISRRLSTILDLNRLVSAVVEQIKETFGYYHTQIYLFDQDNQTLLMVGGTGEEGRAMLVRRHRILKGQGLVGRAAATNNTVLIPDVTQAEDWLANPLLPHTKAELAVPIAVGDQVLGVLDVQQDVQSGLTGEDANLLQSIANQVAIAVQNARLYEQASNQVEREALINTIGEKIRQTTTIDGVLKTAAQELGLALRTKRTGVQIGMKEKNGNGRQ